jgi:ABC-type transport system involved in multi-copper enzyme maturation permease subunit
MHYATAIISKELRAFLRTKKAFSALMAILFGTGATVWLFWLVASWEGELANTTYFSRILFAVLTGVQLGILGLFAPLLTATAITSEREEKTLDLLYCTRIGRFHLLIGKWFAAIAFEALLVLCMLPLTGLCFQLGGVGLEEYLFTMVMTLMTVLTYAMIGLACSAWFRKTATAIFVALLIILFLGGGLALLLSLLDELGWLHLRVWPPESFWDTLMFVSPVISIVGAWATYFDSPTAPGSSNTFLGNPMFLWHLLYQSIIFALAACVCWRALARPEPHKAQVARKPTDDLQLLERRRKRFPYYLIDPLRRPQVIRDNQNPMYVLEVRTNTLLRSTVLIRLSYGLLIFSIGAFCLMLLSNSVPRGIGLLSLFALLPLVPVMTASSLPREWQANTMDLLKASTLPASSIVWGKFRAALRFMGSLWLALLILPVILHFAVLLQDYATQGGFASSAGIHGLGSLAELFEVLLPVAGFLILYTALAIFCASLFRRVAFALVTIYAALALLVFLPQILTLSLLVSVELMRLCQGLSRDEYLPLLHTVCPGLAFLCQLLSPSFYFFPHDSTAGDVAEQGFLPLLDSSPAVKALVFDPLILATAWFFLHLTARRLERVRLKG